MSYDPIVDGLADAVGAATPTYVDDLCGLIVGPEQALRMMVFLIVAGHAEGLFRAIQLKASHGTAAIVASVVAAPLEGATSLSVITDAPPLPSVPKPAEKGEGGGRGRSALSALAAPNGRPTVFSQTFSAAHTRWLLCAAAGSRYVLPLPWGRDGDAAVFPSLQEVFNLSRLELGAEARRDARRS